MAATGATTAISITTSSGTATHTVGPTDTQALFNFATGTFAGFTGTILGSIDGTTFFPIRAFLMGTGAAANGTLTLADNTGVAYVVPCEGLALVRFTATARTSGTLTGSIIGGAFFASAPAPLGNATTGGTLSGVTFAGTSAFTGLPTFAVMPTIPTATVAGAGTNQGTATAVTTGFTLVTAADDTVGVVLPTAVAGLVCIIKSSVANKILKVYPNTSDAINALSANAAISLASGPTIAMFVAYDATTWYTLPLLPS